MMRSFSHISWLLACTLVALFVWRPERISAQTKVADKAKVLDFKTAYELIKLNHPIIKQSNQIADEALEELKMTRGGFDPKAHVDYSHKRFDNKNYYTLFDAYLKVPTWVGLDLVGGFEQNTGTNLSSSDNTANGLGTAYIGATMPVGAGLFIDQRRALLRQAQAGLRMADAERRKAINKLVLQIAKDYWAWYEAYLTVENTQFGFDLANERYQAVKVRALAGDLARIDTVEAMITVQDRQISLRSAQLELQQARLAFEVHLWGEDNQPRELQFDVVPALGPTPINQIMPTAQLEEQAMLKHPEIVKIEAKLEQLEQDRRLAVENLKPIINLKYNYLSGPQGVTNDFNATFRQHNYTFGVQAVMPLFLRKERGKLGMTKVKMSQAELELIQTRRAITNDIKAAAADLQTLEGLIVQQQRMVNNYQTLRDGEIDKFNNGESSLFLVNSRESKLIEGRVKLVSLQSKYQKAQAYLLWAAGLTIE